MSFPLDVAAQNATLDAWLGDNASTAMPTEFEVALFTGDPSAGGTELLSSGGYVRAVVTNESAVFPDAADGQKVSASINFDLPSGPWVGVTANQVTHWLLIDHADSTTRYFSRGFSEPFEIVGDEEAVPVELVVAYNVTGGA